MCLVPDRAFLEEQGKERAAVAQWGWNLPQASFTGCLLYLEQLSLLCRVGLDRYS